MTEKNTAQQDALDTTKKKAYRILREKGVRASILTIMWNRLCAEKHLYRYDSAVRNVEPNKSLETEGRGEAWVHHAYLLGENRLQISFFAEQAFGFDELDTCEEQATIFVTYNEEIVLHSNGSARRENNGLFLEEWKFSQHGALLLERAILREAWMSAVNTVAEELNRVVPLIEADCDLEAELDAKEEQANFDLGGFQ
jgi:hypothetical protein